MGMLCKVRAVVSKTVLRGYRAMNGPPNSESLLIGMKVVAAEARLPDRERLPLGAAHSAWLPVR